MPICPRCHQEGPAVGAECDRDGYHFVSERALREAGNDKLLGVKIADRYVVVERLASGGMGAIYRAVQLPVERSVALKVLHAEVERSSSGRERFRREAKAISRLNHPNVITLHDFGFDDHNRPFMVMEYARGRSCAEWLYSGRVTTEQLVHVARQILSALADAHDTGLIHRDLKPDNVILTNAGADDHFVKLLDFGLVRLIDRESMAALTRDDEVFGTPHYMAPEQSKPDRDVGAPCDVYAMGIMLYEFFCGEVPFHAPRPLQVLFKHLEEPLPEPKPRPGIELPPPLRDVIVKATNKQPEDRYADARQMLAALEDAVEDLEPGTSTPIRRARKSPTPTPHLTARSPAPETERNGEDESSSAVPTLAMASIGDDTELPEEYDAVSGDTYKAWDVDEGDDDGARQPDPATDVEPRREVEPTDEVPRTGAGTSLRLKLGVAAAAVVVAMGAAAVIWVASDDPSAPAAQTEADDEAEAQLDDQRDSAIAEPEVAEPAEALAARVATTAEGSIDAANSSDGSDSGQPQPVGDDEKQQREEPSQPDHAEVPGDDTLHNEPADDEPPTDEPADEPEPPQPQDSPDEAQQQDQPDEPSPFERDEQEDEQDEDEQQDDGPAPFERSGN